MLLTEDRRPLATENNLIITIESRIDRLAQIKFEKSVLEAEEKKLKESLIKDHFAVNDAYMNIDGVILATYKEELFNSFKTELFKRQEPKLYLAYCEVGLRRRFLIK